VRQLPRFSLRATSVWLQHAAPVRLRHQTVRGFFHRQGATHAAALAYYALLSFFPFLIVLLSLTRLVVDDPAMQLRVVEVVISQGPEAVGLGRAIERAIAVLSSTRGGVVSAAGLLVTLFGASQLIGALRKTLNAFFGVTRSRSAIRGTCSTCSHCSGWSDSRCCGQHWGSFRAPSRSSRSG